MFEDVPLYLEVRGWKLKVERFRILWDDDLCCISVALWPSSTVAPGQWLPLHAASDPVESPEVSKVAEVSEKRFWKKTEKKPSIFGKFWWKNWLTSLEFTFLTCAMAKLIAVAIGHLLWNLGERIRSRMQRWILLQWCNTWHGLKTPKISRSEFKLLDRMWCTILACGLIKRVSVGFVEFLLLGFPTRTPAFVAASQMRPAVDQHVGEHVGLWSCLGFHNDFFGPLSDWALWFLHFGWLVAWRPSYSMLHFRLHWSGWISIFQILT